MAAPEPKRRGRRRTSTRGLLEVVPRFRVPADDLALIADEATNLGIPVSTRLREIVGEHVAGRPPDERSASDAASAIRHDRSLDDPSKALLVALVTILRDRVSR